MMRQVNVKLNEDIINRIHETGIPQSQFIRDAIEFYLESGLWQPEAIPNLCEAMQDITTRLERIESSMPKVEQRYVKPLERKEPTTTETDITKPATRAPRLKDDNEAIERIKELWKQSPRPPISQIAEDISYSYTTVISRIKAMIADGELEE